MALIEIDNNDRILKAIFELNDIPKARQSLSDITNNKTTKNTIQKRKLSLVRRK